MSLLRRFLRREDGATAIEYALIAALMAAIVIGGVTLLGTGITTAFTNIQNTLSTAVGGGGGGGGGTP